MRWIAGLGNPGTAYQGTRHNVGFMVIDELARRWGINVTQNKCKALIGEGNVQGTKVVLIKPMTYMNLSGESVRSFLDYFKADLADGVIVYDDLDTEIGKLRLRYQGSAGGHNGIKSLIQHLGTQTFDRVRMGISRPQPGMNIADYVLSSFPKSEQEQLAAMIAGACEAIEYRLKAPFEETMAKFNR
ncbi:MAG: aminoacyl-tRNA hydrolase [Bacillota bacterium]|jgi:PTH1 family peptidyl-tRNA hydrolase|uniref:Peptidyl-tRNA hydrolase n=1 Tax=Paenibacillus prosopidis TaxID=630520 RepID=A0A368VLA4_9BACL|nr:aminoacyl-tRNA hydrolase [Paenibacillus prosopidis]RCW41427.1 PTH1 family peptidyl-tRNA hydrolase [Paenibacillus prosopidis]